MEDRVGLFVQPIGKMPSQTDRSSRELDPLKGGDVHKWAIDQAALIRTGQFGEVDWINVADEIESVGNSEFRSLSSNVEVVLTHMLKWDYQPGRRSRSWVDSIAEHRQRVRVDLADSPSLKSRLRDATDRGYRLARLVAVRETGLSTNTFPKGCPYGWDAIMDREFIVDRDQETE